MQINEIFNSIEGEGINQGLPTTFIRLQGCNNTCKWCDSSHTWNINKGIELSIDKIIEKVKEITNGNWVSITGGDPMLQLDDLKILAKSLINNGYLVNIEHTGIFGANYLEEINFLETLNRVSFDVKPPSSEVNKESVLYGIQKILPYKYTFSIKCVVMDPFDLKFYEESLFPFVDPRTIITINPCDIENKNYFELPSVKLLTEFIMTTNYKNIKIGCQLHKVFNFR